MILHRHRLHKKFDKLCFFLVLIFEILIQINLNQSALTDCKQSLQVVSLSIIIEHNKHEIPVYVKVIT